MTPLPADLPPLPARAPDAHKGHFGRLLIIGGSPGLSGAVILAARAALRSGCGLVTAALPTEQVTPFDTAVPEAMSLTLPADPEGAATGAGERILAPALEQADAVVLGPGLGRARPTEALFAAVLDRYNGPTVIDADGLWFLAGDRERRLSPVGDPDRRTAWVLTPHAREFERLAGSDCANFVAQWPGVLVAKGPRTEVRQGDRTAENETGGPALATGGTGDVLAGVIGAFLARGEEPWLAARRGVWVHGLAGDRAGQRCGEESVIASDVIAELPNAIRVAKGERETEIDAGSDDHQER